MRLTCFCVSMMSSTTACTSPSVSGYSLMINGWLPCGQGESYSASRSPIGLNQRQCHTVAMSQRVLTSGRFFRRWKDEAGSTVSVPSRRLWHTTTSRLSSVHTSMARNLPSRACQKSLPCCESAPSRVVKSVWRSSAPSVYRRLTHAALRWLPPATRRSSWAMFRSCSCPMSSQSQARVSFIAPTNNLLTFTFSTRTCSLSPGSCQFSTRWMQQPEIRNSSSARLSSSSSSFARLTWDSGDVSSSSFLMYWLRKRPIIVLTSCLIMLLVMLSQPWLASSSPSVITRPSWSRTRSPHWSP